MGSIRFAKEQRKYSFVFNSKVSFLIYRENIPESLSGSTQTKVCCKHGWEPCFPFPSQRNKKPHHFFPSCCSLYQSEGADAIVVHSIGDLTQLKSGDTLGPKYNECTQTSHNRKPGDSMPDT